MKERYVSPSVVLIGLASEQYIASSGDIDFDDLLGGGGSGQKDPVSVADGDIDVDARDNNR